jgi:quercetin dioxygenase-like cupin family protein
MGNNAKRFSARDVIFISPNEKHQLKNTGEVTGVSLPRTLYE